MLTNDGYSAWSIARYHPQRDLVICIGKQCRREYKENVDKPHTETGRRRHGCCKERLVFVGANYVIMGAGIYTRVVRIAMASWVKRSIAGQYTQQ